MTTTLEIPPASADAKAANPRVPGDVCAAISELGQSCRSRPKFYREALHAVATHYASPYSAIRITRSSSTLNDSVRLEADSIAMWESATEDVLLESQAEHVPIARMYGVEGTSLQVAVMAIPVCEQADHTIGAMSVIVRCDGSPLAKVYLGEFAALVSLIANTARLLESKAAPASQDDSDLKRAVVKATDFQSLHELAFAITNSLKNKFACDQVTLSQVESGKVGILSISGLDDVYHKSPGVKHIRQAMEECLDYGDVICCQVEDKWSEHSVTTNHCLHRAWHAETGNTPVASVPLLVGDKCVAVLSMSRTKQLPFSEDELTQIRETVTPFAPAMMLVAKADRGLLSHATDSVKQGLSWFLMPKTYQRKAIAAAILLSIAYFFVATTGYQVTTPSQITPAEIRNFTAPFEGTISVCHVEVGDDVNQGDLLYEMDTTDLQLQQGKLKSDLEVLRLRVNQALAVGDVKSAALSGAEMRVIQAQLAITRHKLAEAQVRAPSRGTIVSGELSQRIGEVVPMGAPLMEFVPEGDWSIELLVPESMASELKVGLKGQFACNARLGEILHCKIIRIRPSSEPRDGKNVFIAEAVVKDNPVWMRAGMEGIAQIDVGERRVWWVALHRVIDYIHLTFWL